MPGALQVQSGRRMVAGHAPPYFELLRSGYTDLIIWMSPPPGDRGGATNDNGKADRPDAGGI
ncbi:hypothetical protein ASF84_02665 [Pseudomonas sp. Leaf127]|nr:hypothetical protein ASF84_02665 [Pseudomonas sp. Leaf127]